MHPFSLAGSVDYVPLEKYLLVFNSSVSELTVEYHLVDDSLVEYNETFTASLSLDVIDNRNVINLSVATVIIINDDGKYLLIVQRYQGYYHIDVTLQWPVLDSVCPHMKCWQQMALLPSRLMFSLGSWGAPFS